MQHMGIWSIVLLVVAAWMAVLSLVRLMAKRRNQIIERFRQEVEREKKNQEADRKQKAFENLGRKSA